MEITSRTASLTRYRHLRALNLRHQTAAIRTVSGAALTAQAKRLGLTSGKTIVADDEELNFVFDLSLYTAAAKRLRAIERYARSFGAVPGSDDDKILQSMQTARFSVWTIESRHDLAGFILRDIIHDETVWLIDEGLEISASIGLTFGSRLFRAPDGFWMTCGVSVAVDATMLEPFLVACACLLRKPIREVTDDRRFAEALYKTTIFDDAFSDYDRGMTARISPW